ncbi:hypothetical protein CRENBAI_022709 [Crenichthys baileyi]|uniref:Uncharacterized protein n=1 Tax=Crenichthys baileyi TaxID=28760 RepID=A0AAV9SP61_9TELE
MADGTFMGRAINTVFEHRKDLITCCENTQVTLTLVPSERQETCPWYWNIRALSSFWNFFTTSCNMWTCDKLEKKNIDLAHIKGSIQQIEHDLQNIRNSLHSMRKQSSETWPAKRRQVAYSVQSIISSAEELDAVGQMRGDMGKEFAAGVDYHGPKHVEQ